MTRTESQNESVWLTETRKMPTCNDAMMLAAARPDSVLPESRTGPGASPPDSGPGAVNVGRSDRIGDRATVIGPSLSLSDGPGVSPRPPGPSGWQDPIGAGLPARRRRPSPWPSRSLPPAQVKRSTTYPLGDSG
eukprot:765974-Hanusia_phi.AAC.8